MPVTSEKLIKIASVVDAHGIKGEVKLRSFSEDPNFFKNNPVLYDSSGKKPFTVKVTGQAKNGVIVKIDGINDRNSSELLKNTELFIPASTLPAPAEDEFYYSQLIGLEARLSDGSKYGTVISIENFGAGDVVEITTLSGTSEMLPLEEPWVSEIQIKQGFITVTPAEYS